MDIRTKDGILLRNIPEGTPDEAIKARIQQIRAGQTAQTPATVAAPLPTNDTLLDKVKGSPLGGALMGVRDIVDGGAQLLVRGANKLGLAPDSEVTRVDDVVRGANREYADRRQAAGRSGLDLARVGGGVAASMLMPGATTAKGMAAAGAGYGAMQPVLDGDFAAEKVQQTALGAAGGLLGNAVSRVINPNVAPQTRTLLDEGVRLTPGQALGGSAMRVEDRLMSVPVLGDVIANARTGSIEDLNRAAFARALKPIGQSADSLPTNRDGVSAVKGALTKAYDELLPKIQFKADRQFGQELSTIQQMAQSLTPKEAKTFEGTLKEVVAKMTPQGNMSGATFKEVESKLTQEAKLYRGSLDPDQKKLGDALTEALATFRRGLVRSNPNEAAALKAINEGYANFSVIRDAASRAGDKSDFAFTPSQLAAAVRAQDKSVGKGATATGKALMQDLADAGVTMNSKVPDSGTAGRGLLALLLTGAGTGAGAATGALNPYLAAAVGGAALPYTTPGMRALALVLAKRPQSAEAVADAVKRLSPAVAPAVAYQGNNP